MVERDDGANCLSRVVTPGNVPPARVQHSGALWRWSETASAQRAVGQKVPSGTFICFAHIVQWCTTQWWSLKAKAYIYFGEILFWEDPNTRNHRAGYRNSTTCRTVRFKHSWIDSLTGETSCSQGSHGMPCVLRKEFCLDEMFSFIYRGFGHVLVFRW